MSKAKLTSPGKSNAIKMAQSLQEKITFLLDRRFPKRFPKKSKKTKSAVQTKAVANW